MKKHEEPVEEEETAPFWMISFSDLMSLLMTFFVLLFSMSTIQSEKMKEMMEAMGARYLLHGSAYSGHRLPQANPNLPVTGQARQGAESPPLDVPKTPDTQPLPGTIIPFRTGQDSVDDNGQKILDALVQQLQGSLSPIRIEGHATLNEVDTTVYQTADDLAYTRAYNVRKILISRGLGAERFTLVIKGKPEPLTVTEPESVPNVNAYVKVVEEIEEKE